MSGSGPAVDPAVSVLVPAYNEVDLLVVALRRLGAVPGLDREVIVVDDGSTDGTADLREPVLAEGLADRWLSHHVNRGKGAALITGLGHARGAVIAVQDADLEYDPGLLPELVAPVLAGEVDAVFGSRLLGQPVYGLNVLPSTAFEVVWMLGSQLVNIGASLVSWRRLTEVETCQKVVRTDLLRSLDLRETGFGIEVEMVLKLARSGARLRELPISYYPRSVTAGKKIGPRDGIEALVCILRYGALRR